MEVSTDVKSIGPTYEITSSPENSSLYSEIPRAICEAFHIKAKLPWSLPMDNTIRWMWEHLFVRKTVKNHAQYMHQLAIGSVATSYVSDLDVNNNALSTDDWDALMLSNACLRICMYFDRYAFLRDETLSGWHDISQKLLQALEHRLQILEDEQRKLAERKNHRFMTKTAQELSAVVKQKISIEVLLWRMTMDYITPIYNLYLDENKLLTSGEHRKKLLGLMERIHFSECADLYGNYFPTVPGSLVNRIAMNSILRNEESYPVLLDRFLNYLFLVYCSGSILHNQREQLRQYAESIVGFLSEDKDFSHFRLWLGGIDGASNVEAFLKKHQDRCRTETKEAGRIAMGTTRRTAIHTDADRQGGNTMTRDRGEHPNVDAETRLEDYRPPPFLVDTVDLDIDLEAAESLVTSTLVLRRAPGASLDAPLVLDGRELELVDVASEGRILSANEYGFDDEGGLVLPATFFNREGGSEGAADPCAPFSLRVADPHSPRAQYPLQGALYFEWDSLNPMRGGRFSADHLLPGPSGCPRKLHHHAACRALGLSRAALQRQSRGERRDRRRPALGTVGGSLSQAFLPVCDRRGRPRPCRKCSHHRLGPRGPAPHLHRSAQRRALRSRDSRAAEGDALGRGGVRTRIRPPTFT